MGSPGLTLREPLVQCFAPLLIDVIHLAVGLARLLDDLLLDKPVLIEPGKDPIDTALIGGPEPRDRPVEPLLQVVACLWPNLQET